MDGGSGTTQKAGEGRKLAVIAVALVAVGALAVALTVWLGPSTPGGEREAVKQCEGFADSRLKAPADADYNLAASEQNGSWTVVGTVDSENSFGAKVRSDVRCVMHFTSDQAVLDDISVG